MNQKRELSLIPVSLLLDSLRSVRVNSGSVASEEQRSDESADEQCAESALRLLLLLCEDDRAVVETLLTPAVGALEALACASKDEGNKQEAEDEHEEEEEEQKEEMNNENEKKNEQKGKRKKEKGRSKKEKKEQRR